jgi:hypothetical protein
MLNLEALFRSMFKSGLDSEERTLELKVGQIVKGVLLKMLSENEALFRMNGTLIRAQLETPVRPGQETWFQVQSPSNVGRIALKVLPYSTSIDGGKAVLEMIGMKFNEMNKNIVMALLENRMPVTKESISSIHQAIRHLPNEVPQDTGIKTGIIVVQRGLSPTSAVANSIAAALRSMNSWAASWDVLRQGVTKWAQSQEASINSPLRVENNTEVNVNRITPDPSGRGIPEQPLMLKSQSSAQSSTFPAIQPQNPERSTEQARVLPQGQTSDLAAKGRAAAEQETPSSPITLAKSAAPFAAVTASYATTTGAPSVPITSASFSPSLITPMQILEALDQLEETAQKVVGNYIPSDAASVESTTSHSKGDSLRQLLQSLGFIKNIDVSGNPNISTLDGQIMAQGGTAASAPPPSLETLKNMLSQLLQYQDIPASVRESAQQLLHQTMGHQIMSLPLQSDSHVQMMLQLPFFTGQGESATIYVQSRKRKGEPLSVEKCRLFFHLQMNHIGETWVDVDIHRRSVDIKVMSNHPEIEQLIVKQIDSLKGGLDQHGYQIGNVKTSTLPTKSARVETLGASTPISISDYKGVDFRI